jgi:hypothetical protein
MKEETREQYLKRREKDLIKFCKKSNRPLGMIPFQIAKGIMACLHTTWKDKRDTDDKIEYAAFGRIVKFLRRDNHKCNICGKTARYKVSYSNSIDRGFFVSSNKFCKIHLKAEMCKGFNQYLKHLI